VIDPTRPHLIVLNKDEDTVWYLDALNGEHVHTTPVAHNPHEVVISADRRWTVISSSLGKTVSKLDNASGEVVAELRDDSFDFPHGLAVLDARTLLLTATGANLLYYVDLPSFAITRRVATHQHMVHMVEVRPGGHDAAIANIGSNSVSILDTQSATVRATVPVGKEPEGIAYSRDGRVLIVADQGDGVVRFLDADSLELLRRDRLGQVPIRVCTTPDGRQALIPNRESGDLSFIDLEARREWKRIRVGLWPGGTVTDPSGVRAFVANNKTNDISVIDLASAEVEATLVAGLHPDGMAYLPGGDGD
jgi:YVTN family beta-propeller protein